MKSLYSENTIMGRIFSIFSKIFSNTTKPTKKLLTVFLIGLLVNENFSSVRNLHKSFLANVYDKSLNSYYHALSNDKLQNRSIMQSLTQMAVGLIPEGLAKEPVFISVDDTTIAKYGKHFADVSSLYDHSIHDSNNRYVNGHCFVSLTMSIPVHTAQEGFPEQIRYIPISLGYAVWNKDKSKFLIAADLLDEIMPILKTKHVILTFDSWYAKTALIERALQYENLDIICNARHDTAVYALKEKATGRKGRPKKHGKKLTLEEIVDAHGYGCMDGYKISHKVVETNIFCNRTVHAYVTQSAKNTNGQKRLFFSTFSMAEVNMSCAWQEKEMLRNCPVDAVWFYPMKLYKLRWHIETNYYEQKTFWSLSKYMLRKRIGIERMLNLINVAHGMAKMLPYLDDKFSDYKNFSPQEVRHEISNHIHQEIFFDSLANHAQSMKNSNSFIECLWNIGQAMGIVA